MKTRTCYTDGASSPDGTGGWAWWMDDENYAYGYAAETTNQRMEQMAVIEVLELFRPGPITIYSDSAYVVNCMNLQWWRKWEKNGWLNSSQEPVANQDLWEQMLSAVAVHTTPPTFVHIRGHGKGDQDPKHTHGNDRADSLAVYAKKSWRFAQVINGRQIR